MKKINSYEQLVKKAEAVVKEKKLDLSSDEDLSIGVMNLISIEEHLFFTAEKTGKDVYYDMLREVREMRKELLQKLIQEYEGEVWCTGKHLLSASMRMMEVGTKQLGSGNKEAAKPFFEKAYDLYSLFWTVILTGGNSAANTVQITKNERAVSTNTKAYKKLNEQENSMRDEATFPQTRSRSFFESMRSFVKKAVDCCKE